MTTEPNDPTRAGPALADLPASTGLSRNEIETLCAKAARGAGMSWGHAEEAGFAAGWLHARGLDGAAALLAQLDRAAGKAWTEVCPVVSAGEWRPSGAESLCPVALGAALSDHCELPEGALRDGLVVGPVSQPLLVLPFLARIAGVLGHPIDARFGGGALSVGPAALSGDVAHLAVLTDATLELWPGDAPEATPPAPHYASGRRTLAALDALALQTTVPPSEQSRADAGARTSDND